MNVKDRVAVITGSRQGIGAGIAAVLGAAGARIVVNDLTPTGRRGRGSSWRRLGSRSQVTRRPTPPPAPRP